MQANVPDYLARMVRSYLANKSCRFAIGHPRGRRECASRHPTASCRLQLGAVRGRQWDHRERWNPHSGVTAYVAYLTAWKIKVNESKSPAILYRHRPCQNCFRRLTASPSCPVEMLDEVDYLGLTTDNKRLYRARTDKLNNRCIGLLKSLYPLISGRS